MRFRTSLEASLLSVASTALTEKTLAFARDLSRPPHHLHAPLHHSRAICITSPRAHRFHTTPEVWCRDRSTAHAMRMLHCDARCGVHGAHVLRIVLVSCAVALPPAARPPLHVTYLLSPMKVFNLRHGNFSVCRKVYIYCAVFVVPQYSSLVTVFSTEKKTFQLVQKPSSPSLRVYSPPWYVYCRAKIWSGLLPFSRQRHTLPRSAQGRCTPQSTCPTLLKDYLAFSFWRLTSLVSSMYSGALL